MNFDWASLLFRQVREVAEERARSYEAVIGIVTDNKDPQKLCRVKVRMPTISGVDTTSWVPIVMPGAGKDRGWFFLPEVNDEVLVVFEHGDVNHPVVIGAMWNGKDRPPHDNSSGTNSVRALVSRSGSRVEFDDEKGTVVIEDGGTTGRITFDAEGNKISLEATSGDVCIQAPNGGVGIHAGEIELTATMNLEIRGSTVNLGGADVALKASGPLTIFGGTTDINPGGTQGPADYQGSVTEYPDPVGGNSGTGGGGRGGAAASAGAGSGTGGTGSFMAMPPLASRGLRMLHSDDDFGAAALLPAPASSSTTSPLITAVTWSRADEEIPFEDKTVLSAKVDNIPDGSSMSIEIAADADDAPAPVTRAVTVTKQRVELEVTTKQLFPDLRGRFGLNAKVSGGGAPSAQTAQVQIVRMRYWEDPGLKLEYSLEYHYAWSTSKKVPGQKVPEKEWHDQWGTSPPSGQKKAKIVDSRSTGTPVDDSGETLLAAASLTDLMDRHVKDRSRNTEPGYIVDLQADLLALGLAVDTEDTLTTIPTAWDEGVTYPVAAAMPDSLAAVTGLHKVHVDLAKSHTPSGVFGPVTAFSIAVLAHYGGEGLAVDASGVPTTAPVKVKAKPKSQSIVVDHNFAKAIRAWLGAGVLAPTAAQQPVVGMVFGKKYSPASYTMSRRFRAWFEAVEKAGGILWSGYSPRAIVEAPGKRTSAGRSEKSLHYVAKALDLTNDLGATLPGDLFVVADDPVEKRQWILFCNQDVAGRLRRSKERKTTKFDPAVREPDPVGATPEIRKWVEGVLYHRERVASVARSALKKTQAALAKISKTLAAEAATLRDLEAKASSGTAKQKQLDALQKKARTLEATLVSAYAIGGEADIWMDLLELVGQKVSRKPRGASKARDAATSLSDREDRWRHLKDEAAADITDHWNAYAVARERVLDAITADDDRKRVEHAFGVLERAIDGNPIELGAAQQRLAVHTYQDAIDTLPLEERLIVRDMRLQIAELSAQLRRKAYLDYPWTLVAEGLRARYEGNVVRLDDLASAAGLYKINRHDDWERSHQSCEWWHYQVYDPKARWMNDKDASTWFGAEALSIHGPFAAHTLLGVHDSDGTWVGWRWSNLFEKGA